MFVVILLYVFLRGTGAVIYRLDDADYARMPPLMQMDSYEACQLETDALYCTAEVTLGSDKPSPLLNMIKEYSDHHTTHYNHTLLRYGICVTQTCKKFYNKEEDVDLKYILEACLNESLSQKYELKVKYLDEYYCQQPGKPADNIDLLDVVVGVICLAFLLANLIGSVCDFHCDKAEVNIVVRLLKCFSLRRNWNKFTNPLGDQDGRVQLLKCIHGIRFLSMVLVIAAHAAIPFFMAIKNPQFVENVYTFKAVSILLNGSLIMQTFLMISGFLLIYNCLIYSESNQVSWNMLPKLIIIRWLRLTPSYGFVLALTVTWFRHLASGPYWSRYVAAEMTDCRQYWWYHIFYINNYFQNTSKCMVQSWYLAVDTQLYVIAVIIYLACRTDRSRQLVLSSLSVIGTLAVVAHVYLQDLDGAMLAIPEISSLNVFVNSPFFINVFKRAHTNLVGYIMGMALGFLVYNLQKQEIDFQKYQKLRYRLLVWSALPLGVLCCYIGNIFYADTPRPSVYIRTLYAALSKPVFAMAIGGILFGCIFKSEGIFRPILEWRFWTVPSRLTYSAYLLHVAFVRIYFASITEVTDRGYFTLMQLIAQMLVKTFVAALFFWLLVEAPLSNVIKEYLSAPKVPYQEKKKA